MVLGDTAGARCVRNSSLDTVRVATAARTMRRSCRESIMRGRPNLVYGCGNVPQTHHRYIVPIMCKQSVDMSSQLPTGIHCDPVQMAEFRQQVHDAWDNLSQDDIRHLYDCLHVRTHSCVGARVT